MKIIQITANENGARPPLQNWNSSTPPIGYAFLPDEFVHVFYPQDKQCAGFVDITVEGDTVTACTWNEEAYQAYIASLPEPEPEPEPEPTESSVYDELDAAYQEGVSSAYDS